LHSFIAAWHDNNYITPYCRLSILHATYSLETKVGRLIRRQRFDTYNFLRWNERSSCLISCALSDMRTR